MSNVVDKIELLESGQIVFRDADDNILRTEDNDLGLRTYSGNDGILITRNNEPIQVVLTASLTRLQIQPAAETTFGGTTQQLMEELASNFFR